MIKQKITIYAALIISICIITVGYGSESKINEGSNNGIIAPETVPQKQFENPKPNIYIPDKAKQKKIISWLTKEGIPFTIEYLDPEHNEYITWDNKHDERVREAVLKIDRGEDPDIFLPNEKPKNTDSGTSNELSVRAEIRWQTSSAFKIENFKELEKLAKAYSEQDERTPSGAQKISLFEDGLKLALSPARNGRTEEYCFQMEEKTRKWIANYPESPWAHLAYSMALVEHADFLRGTGYADTVPKEAWKSYYKYLNLANDYLDKNKSVAANDLGWYEMKIVIGKSLGWDQKQIDLLVDEAFSKKTNDNRIYFAVAEYLLPKWHGDAEQLDQFINYVVSRTEKQSGMELYARLYSAASTDQYGNQLFTQSKASWKKMKEGLDDWLKRYPETWNVNIYAHFACIAGDKEKAQELMKIIGDKPELTVWDSHGEEGFRYCRDWALSP